MEPPAEFIAKLNPGLLWASSPYRTVLIIECGLPGANDGGAGNPAVLKFLMAHLGESRVFTFVMEEEESFLVKMELTPCSRPLISLLLLT